MCQNNLTNPQWAVGLASISVDELDGQVQKNNFSYLASIHRDLVEFGLLAGHGAHAVILVSIEEGKAPCSNL